MAFELPQHIATELLNTDPDELYRQIIQGIEDDLYGEKEHAHSGPFQQDMVAYIMAGSDLNAAQANLLFARAYTNHNTLIGIMREVNGSPIEPKSIGDAFKDAQRRLKIEDLLEFQGLRKSGQMHKVRLSNNNYQLVAEAAGQSPEVLMSNYNEALECEKRALSEKVEESFYATATNNKPAPTEKKEYEAQDLLLKVQEDPDLSQQLLRLLLSSAISSL